MKAILVRRILASLTDYLVIVLYAALLFLFSTLIFCVTSVTPSSSNPLVGQLIGFFTLTLPVVAYSYLTESGTWRGTLGKKALTLVVESEQKISKSIYSPKKHSKVSTLGNRTRWRSLDCMTAETGAINKDTIFIFSQEGNRVSGKYSGGPINEGYLVGIVNQSKLIFSYCQLQLASQPQVKVH